MSPTEDPDDPDSGPVLSPEELDISDDDHVAEIEDGRFVVSSQEGKPPAPPTDATDSGGDDDGSDPPASAGRTEANVDLDEREVRRWLAERAEDVDARYGFHVTATFDDDVRHRQLFSDDAVTVFEGLLLWYVQGFDRSTPVEEAIGLLLVAGNMPVRFPAESLEGYLAAHDLDPDDSIADLLATAEDGFVFPPLRGD